MDEPILHDQILSYLKSAGLLAWRNTTLTTFDIVGYFPNGQGFQIAVKGINRHLHDWEIQWMFALTQTNCAVCVAATLDEVKDFINNYPVSMLK